MTTSGKPIAPVRATIVTTAVVIALVLAALIYGRVSQASTSHDAPGPEELQVHPSSRLLHTTGFAEGLALSAGGTSTFFVQREPFELEEWTDLEDATRQATSGDS